MANQQLQRTADTRANMPEMPTNRLTVRLDSGDEVDVSMDALRAYTALNRPTRDAWRDQLNTMGAVANNREYSICNQIATAYSALNGRGEWVSDEARQTLCEWLTTTPPQSDDN